MITKSGELRIVIGKIPVTATQFGVGPIQDIQRARTLASFEFGGTIPSGLMISISREANEIEWLVTLKPRIKV